MPAAFRISSLPALVAELSQSSDSISSMVTLAGNPSTPAIGCSSRDVSSAPGSASIHFKADFRLTDGCFLGNYHTRSSYRNENPEFGLSRACYPFESTAVAHSTCFVSSFRVVHGFGFTTAAMNIVEPGKSWRGKGWNRVGVEKPAFPASEGDCSTSSNFDCIPDLEKKLQFLETCGLGTNQLGQMRKLLPSAVKNTILKLSIKKLIEVATFLEEEVGVQKKDFGNLLFANPYIAGSSVEYCLRPKVDFLRNRGITKEQMGKMVVRSPQLLTYSLEGKLIAMEQKLLEMGLKGDEIAKVFVKYPAVFGTSLRKFDKNFQSLKDGGIIEVAKAIYRIPQIMSLTLDDKFQQIKQFLQDELLLDRDQISKIISCQLSILTFSVQDNIRPKVKFFSELGLPQDDIARLVVRYPNVFCHSLDNSIKPKVLYLKDVMHLEVAELISFPQYLSYSLSGRIIPRHEFVTKHGFPFKLSSLLTCNDKVYEKRYVKAKR